MAGKRVYIIIASDHEPNQFTMDDLNAVEKCLLRGEYPDNFTKAEKANLRTKEAVQK